MRFVLIVGFLYSLLFADAIDMSKILEKFYKNIHSETYLRGVADLSPYEAKKYIGGYAIVNYYLGDTYYKDKLFFTRYDISKKMIFGTRTTINGQSNVMVCGKGPTIDYQLMCAAKLSEYSQNLDWYYLKFDGTNISGLYDFGSSEEAANTFIYANYLLKPLYGTFYPKESSSISSLSSSSSSQSTACMPGQPCGDLSYSNSSTSSLVACESNIKYGTADEYKNGNENLPGTGPKIVYTKDVVDQIIEDKLAQCRQDPKSCGINAIPLITTKSDPNEVIDQIKNKDLNINGYYIHYGNGMNEWIYVPVGLSSAYKLEKGVNEDYSLRWTPLPQGIEIEKKGTKIKITK